MWKEVTYIIIPMLQMRRLRHREMEGWKGSGHNKAAAEQNIQFRTQGNGAVAISDYIAQ